MLRDKTLRPFLTLWTGQAFSLLGSQIVQFAIIWWLTQQTGSATLLATASLVGLLPQVILGPFIGVWVDRLNRRLILFASDAVIAVATIVLMALFALEMIAVWHIFLLLFVRAVFGAFHWSTMQATTSLMVPEERLTNIQGLNQIVQGGLNIASAPLGALVVSLLPMAGVLLIDVVTAIFAILPLFFVHIPQPIVSEDVDEEKRPSFLADFQSGLRYILGWPGMLFLMGMAMFANFMLVPAVSLLPLLVFDYFQQSAYFLSLINVTFGIGIIVGGMLLASWGGFKKKIVTSLLGMLTVGIGMGIIGFIPSAGPLYLVIAASTIVGLALAVTNGPIHAIMQSTIAPDMQGRVFALIGSATSAMSPIGLIIAGPLADRLSVSFWYMAAGIGAFVVGLAGFFIPQVMNIEENRVDIESETTEEETIMADPDAQNPTLV
ncbi:MAG: MFS transporter [Chloroflexota bacterium]